MSSPAPVVPPVLKEEQTESADPSAVQQEQETSNSPPSNQANVEKMLQVFQQFASNQQGSQQGKIKLKLFYFYINKLSIIIINLSEWNTAANTATTSYAATSIAASRCSRANITKTVARSV